MRPIHFHNKRFSKQAISNVLKVLTSPGVYNTVTLHGTAFNKETPQIKNRNGTRSNVEHVKFVVVNKKVRTLFTEKKKHTREEERNLSSVKNLEKDGKGQLDRSCEKLRSIT